MQGGSGLQQAYQMRKHRDLRALAGSHWNQCGEARTAHQHGRCHMPCLPPARPRHAPCLPQHSFLAQLPLPCNMAGVESHTRLLAGSGLPAPSSAKRPHIQPANLRARHCCLLCRLSSTEKKGSGIWGYISGSS